MTIPSINTRFQFFLFEEGASQYRPEFSNLYYLWHHFNKIQFVNKLINIKLGRLYEKRGLVHYFSPYRYNNGHLEIDDQVANFYKEAQHISPVIPNPKRILIAMQSIQAEEIRVARDVAPVLEELGYEVIIKEHPRYPLDGYGLDKYRIDAKGKGLEVLVQEIVPKYIIGFWSTTLLTMNYLYNITSISLYLLLDWKEMDAEELQACGWFYKTFKEVVRYPHSMEELRHILT